MKLLPFRKGGLLLIGLAFCYIATAASAPRDTVKRWQGVSVRTNLVWDAAAEPNLGIEIPVSKHFSLDLDAGIKTWPRWLFWDNDNIQNPRHWRNFTVVPELRYYLKEVYDGFFAGADVLYTHFNVGNVTFPFNLYKDVRDHRVQGDLWGLGLFAGWSWWIARHWRIEAQAGAALGWASYDRFNCEHCGTKLSHEAHLAVIPKLGVELAWNPVPRQQEPDCDLPIPLKEIEQLPNLPPPSANPGEFRPQLPPVEPHRGAVDSVRSPLLQHISEYRPYTPDQVLRKKKGSMKVYFAANSATLKPWFKEKERVCDNGPALDSIVMYTRLILADTISRIEKIQIVGFASIEGKESLNNQLALERAQSLQAYVQARVHAPSSAYCIENGQEGWAEFTDLVQDSPLTPAEKEKILCIAGSPTLEAADNRRKERELRADKALWERIRDHVLREQRSSGYVRVYVSWIPDTAAEEINRAIGLINNGRVEEGTAVLMHQTDDRVRGVLDALQAQKTAYEQARKDYEAYQAALARREQVEAQNREAEAWNQMARAHNQAVQECLTKTKKKR